MCSVVSKLLKFLDDTMTHQEPLFLTLPEARLVAISSFFTIKFGLYIMYGSDEQISMKLPQHRPASSI